MTEKQPTINREKLCPFLIRVYYRDNEYNQIEFFSKTPKIASDREVHIYTWMDATLRELTDLLKDVIPSADAPESTLSFSAISINQNGRFFREELGKVKATRPGPDDKKSLESLNFKIGDYLDIAIRK